MEGHGYTVPPLCDCKEPAQRQVSKTGNPYWRCGKPKTRGGCGWWDHEKPSGAGGGRGRGGQYGAGNGGGSGGGDWQPNGRGAGGGNRPDGPQDGFQEWGASPGKRRRDDGYDGQAHHAPPAFNSNASFDNSPQTVRQQQPSGSVQTLLGNNNNHGAGGGRSLDELAEELKLLTIQVKELSGSVWRIQNDITSIVGAKLDNMKGDIVTSLGGIVNSMNIVQDTLVQHLNERPPPPPQPHPQPHPQQQQQQQQHNPKISSIYGRDIGEYP